MGCGDPVTPVDRNPFGLNPTTLTDPSRVEFDDTEVALTTDLRFAAPQGAFASGGVESCNASDGSRYTASLSAAGLPGVTEVGLNPRVGVGGLSLGLFVSGARVTPQFGIGGVSIAPGFGVCAGFWCVGPAGAGPLPPIAIGILAGAQVIETAVTTERDEEEAFPLVAAAQVVSGLVPIGPVREALGVLGIPTGGGPDAQVVKTVDELIVLRREVEEGIGGPARLAVLNSLEESLAIPQDPFVEAELRGLADKARAAQNERGIPGRAIEGKIREAVESVERFLERYQPWLASGTGPAPDTGEIDSFLADSLYLARKLQFLSETVHEDGQEDRQEDRKIVIKIRQSAPFQIRDPELAVRYIESVAALFRLLEDGESGLSRVLHERTEARSEALVDALKTAPLEAHRVQEVEAKRAWHVSWVQTMGLLYESGYFHRRLEHVRWIVRRSGRNELDKRSGRKELEKRLEQVRFAEVGRLARSVLEVSTSEVLSPERYAVLRPGIEALRAVGELAQADFPGWDGDGSLLFDVERARRWPHRFEIVDAFYRMAPALRATMGTMKTGRAASAVSEEARWLRAMVREAEKRLLAALPPNRAELFHEWHRYLPGFPIRLRENIGWRLERGGSAIGRINPKDLEMPDWIAPSAVSFAERLQEMKEELARAGSEALRFRVEGFENWDELFEAEAGESERINEVTAQFRRRFLPAYEAFKAEVGRSPLAKLRSVQKLFREWDKAIGQAAGHLERARSNYERFNARRIGRFFFPHYVRRAGIDPVQRPDDSLSF